jgi:hypothetical protein
MHSPAAADALGGASPELLASQEDEEAVLLAARERIFVAARDPSLRVQLQGSAALGPALRYSPLKCPPPWSLPHLLLTDAFALEVALTSGKRLDVPRVAPLQSMAHTLKPSLEMCLECLETPMSMA